MDQSKSRAGFLSHGPQKPEHPGSKSSALFGRLTGEAALVAAGAVQLRAGRYRNYVFKVVFVFSGLRQIFRIPSPLAGPCGGRGPAGPQRLPAKPGLPECWIVLRETPVPLPTPSTPHGTRRPLLPARVELARHLCHDCPQRRGDRQRDRLPGILQSFRVSGVRRRRNRQGASERRPSFEISFASENGWITFPNVGIC